MVVDPSVPLQILFEEPGAEEALGTLLDAPEVIVTTPGLLEGEIVFGSRVDFGSGAVLELVERLGARLMPFTLEHVAEARLAYARFGRGRGHAARLDVGDCVSYAVVRSMSWPLVFEGDDFIHTDLDLVRTS
jgi:ribonuclease VapC